MGVVQEIARTMWGAPSVQGDDDEAEFGETLRLEVIEERHRETLGGANGLRTRVDGVDDGIAAAGIEGARPEEISEQRCAPIRRKYTEGLDGHESSQAQA